MPRVILAPIFSVWFGLRIWSKVALAITLVFFVVFFNVYQGVKEVSPTILSTARMLGCESHPTLAYSLFTFSNELGFLQFTHLYWLSIRRCCCSGEYLGSAKGVGYLILQARGTFDINTVFAVESFYQRPVPYYWMRSLAMLKIN
jgi:NitT/TauT family transport system permease protein